MCISSPKVSATPVAATPVQEAVAPVPTAVQTTDLGKSTAAEEAIKDKTKKRGYASTMKSQDVPTLMGQASTSVTGNTTLG